MKATLFLLIIVLMLAGVSCQSTRSQASAPKCPPKNSAMTMDDVNKLRGEISKWGVPIRLKKYTLAEANGAIYTYVETLTTPPPTMGNIVGYIRGNPVLTTDDPTEVVIIRRG